MQAAGYPPAFCSLCTGCNSATVERQETVVYQAAVPAMQDLSGSGDFVAATSQLPLFKTNFVEIMCHLLFHHTAA